MKRPTRLQLLLAKMKPESPERMRKRVYKNMRQDAMKEIKSNWIYQAER
jgi:hypothetical protein